MVAILLLAFQVMDKGSRNSTTHSTAAFLLLMLLFFVVVVVVVLGFFFFFFGYFSFALVGRDQSTVAQRAETTVGSFP